MQATDSHIVNDIVISPLGKTTVNVAHRDKPILSHAGTESHGMPLSDTHIKAPLRHLPHHDAQRAACRHSRSDPHDTPVATRQFEDSMSEYVLKARSHASHLTLHTLPRLRTKPPRRMKRRRVLLRRLKPLTLSRMKMQQPRPLHILDATQRLHQSNHIMPVLRSEIANIHTLKHILLIMDKRLDRIVETQQPLLPLVRQPAPSQKLPGSPVTPPVVSSRSMQSVQILFHTPHTTIDTHIVVIEHDEQIIRHRRSIVQPLESQAPTHTAITDDRHDMTLLSLPLSRHRHTQSHRNRHRSMSARSRVIHTLLRRGKRLDAPQMAIRMKRLTPARENLMHIRLMPHVPHDTILRRIKDIMQSHS